MTKKIIPFLLLLGITLFVGACKENIPKKKTPKEKRESEKNYTARVEKAFAEIIDSSHLKGSFVLYDFQKEKYYSNDLEWAKVERSPASTFKIPNSIIAIETGVVVSDTSKFIWDGKPRRMEAWEKDLTLEEAFKVSCVPCFQEVARNIGYDRMKQYLGRFNYGNMVFSKATIDKFWLEGESSISQYQQIDFLERFYHDGLGVSERTTNLVKKIMLIEETDTYKLYGKTGWSDVNNKVNGWFVGFIEVGQKVYFFATNLDPTPSFNMDNFKDARVNITKRVLEVAGLLK